MHVEKMYLQILVFLCSEAERCLYTAVMFLMSICTFQLADVYPEFFSVFYRVLATELSSTFLPSKASSNISMKFHCVFNESMNFYVGCWGGESRFL